MSSAVILANVMPMAGATDRIVMQAVIQPGEVLVAAIVFGTMGTILYPLARAMARRLEGGAPSAAPSLQGVEDRLDRIERAVESIAVEVERVSEGQRFVTKLLAEKTPSPLPPARP
ncbi:MAG: hypothetical protein C0497_07435 [Gemmatimonas sp.]|nr:hypothetical protein [Gemmatimonas sp.]